MKNRLMLSFLLLAAASLAATARAQTVTLYDGFSGASLDTARWQIINQAGTLLAGTSTTDGTLTVTGKASRTGAASNARLAEVGAVEVTALGWTGTNQILQLYSGDGAFNHFIEFGLEGTDPDGTPILNVWQSGGAGYRGRSPVNGPISPENPTTLRIERDGDNYRFLANGIVVHTRTTSALNNDARVMLYGWSTSVSRWDNVKMSGPEALITHPKPGSTTDATTPVIGATGAATVSWTLDVGEGASPAAWTRVADGQGPTSGVLAQWDAENRPNGAYSLRLRATDADGFTRAAWSTFVIARPGFHAPQEGQRVGPSFPVVLENTSGIASVRYFDNGVEFAASQKSPFLVRRVVPEGADGEHTITAEMTMANGLTTTAAPVRVTVQTDLYGPNARPADNGRAFIFPNGTTTVAVGQNDGYPWPDLWQAYRNKDYTTTENYVKMLRANGVNVMRLMLEYAHESRDLLENPLGVYNKKVVAFWDWFFPMCQRNGMTVLLTPWDTFWMNQPWSENPYNAANGGPCATQADFIRSPEARAWQKKRFKYIIDRWGDSPAIFAIDLLNEFDIWWSPASPNERADWVNEMAAYVRDYELQKWGRAHMLTVSSAAAEPGGVIGDIIYRHPLFEFANTHQYYYGTVNNPKNIIDPAGSVNRGVKYSLGQIRDGRPYVDTESGPIDLPAPWLTNDTPFDDQYYHHMAWAHFASGGSGPGMRWPYRQPHFLTPGMHQTQRAISLIAGRLDWNTFALENADARISVNKTKLIAWGSADDRQAVVWITQDVRGGALPPAEGVEVTLSGLRPGRYEITSWDPYSGAGLRRAWEITSGGAVTALLRTFTLDVAVTVRPLAPGDVNADTLINMTDVAQSLAIVAGLRAATASEAYGADLDGDGAVQLHDTAALLNAVVNGEAPA